MNAYEVLNISPAATRDEIRNAYRALARRWHPDRFMEGPERDWANDKMAQINAAYHACLNGTAAPMIAEDDETRLARVQQLIDCGDYCAARKMLMGFATRCAEWNYLFGAVLMRTNDRAKALIYLKVAANQNPGCAKYAAALKEAAGREEARARRILPRFALRRG